jgi:hypothetical protein
VTYTQSACAAYRQARRVRSHQSTRVALSRSKSAVRGCQLSLTCCPSGTFDFPNSCIYFLKRNNNVGDNEDRFVVPHLGSSGDE